MGKTKEKTDSAIQQKESVTECLLYLLGCAVDRCRIRDAPVRRNRLSGPDWANFVCCVVTNRENKVQLRGVRFREFVPTFAAKPICRNVCDLKLSQCFWSDLSCRMASSTVSRELGSPLEVHDPLSHDRPRRVACTQKQHVEMWFHGQTQLQQVGAQHAFALGFTALANALKNLPSTCGARVSTSMFCPDRNSRASST